MSWSFTGIQYPVECVYTQSIGFSADVAVVTFLPQLSAVPSVGTLTLQWEAVTASLPNCVVDLGTLRLTESGRFGTLRVFDRRKRWERVAPISGEYNVVRTGDYVAAKQKNLRQLGVLLMTALGEPGADVSALPTDIYPSVSWLCDDVVEVAEALFSEYGYSVALGFGSEAVTVVKLGTGATLSTVNRFIGSDTIDDKFAPRYVRNCFKPSAIQGRLKLEAVGLDTDGSWYPIDSLSFAPVGGWGSTPPYSLGDAVTALTDAQRMEALSYVRRAYRPVGFADGTWNLPDGSGVVSGLTDILPLQNHLLETEDLRADDSRQPFRVYGKYTQMPRENAQPALPITTDIGDRLQGIGYVFDSDTGLVIFDEPVWYINAGTYVPAELYIEVTFGVRNATTFQWSHYMKDVEVVPTGTGYHTARHDLRLETVVSYNATHVVTGTSDNQTALDTLSTATATAVAGLYATSASQFVVYDRPKLLLRCDGAIQQIKHVMTCGEYGNAVNRTEASRNFEFDRGIPSRAQRATHLRTATLGARVRRASSAEARSLNFDD